MLNPYSRKRIAARDRRIAAIHEAGHVTMARHVGLTDVSAWLEETRDPGEYDKLWIGHTRYPSPSISRISRRKLAMFAVAGTVAELCWQRETFAETLDFDMWLEPETMSESDWAGCDCEPGNPSPQLLKIIKTVFLLFDREAGKLWPDVVSEARSQMKNS